MAPCARIQVGEACGMRLEGAALCGLDPSGVGVGELRMRPISFRKRARENGESVDAPAKP